VSFLAIGARRALRWAVDWLMVVVALGCMRFLEWTGEYFVIDVDEMADLHNSGVVDADKLTDWYLKARGCESEI